MDSENPQEKKEIISLHQKGGSGMQLRRIATVTSIVIFVAMIIAVIRGKSSDLRNSDSTNTASQPSKEQKKDVPGTIDGSKNPNLIPDRAAYLVLFGVIPEQKDEKSTKRARNYVSQILGGCSKCKSVKDKDSYEKAKKDHDQDIDGFLSVVAEFRQRKGALDIQVAGIKDRHWPNPSPAIMEQLAQLQRQKEDIIDELTTALPFRVKVEGVNGIKGHISNIKGKIKMIPGPAGPPGTPEWKQGSPSGHIH